jgi:ribosomal protein S18 acetylase RimI-like enzyme
LTIFGRTVVWWGREEAIEQKLVPAAVGITTSLFSRLAAYYTRHGLWATIRRAGLAIRRALFSNRMILFYCDLHRQTSPPADLPSFLKVERKTSAAELSPEDLQAMTSFWNPKLTRRHMKGRFGKGASLWLIKSEGELAGYGWTLLGHTIEPHYFPPGGDDVHLFDFHVFPGYRGRSMNPFLVTHILRNLATEGAGRALIEVAEWNQVQLSSLSKTPFRRLGWARKLTVFGRTLVCWAEN